MVRLDLTPATGVVPAQVVEPGEDPELVELGVQVVEHDWAPDDPDVDELGVQVVEHGGVPEDPEPVELGVHVLEQEDEPDDNEPEPFAHGGGDGGMASGVRVAVPLHDAPHTSAAYVEAEQSLLPFPLAFGSR